MAHRNPRSRYPWPADGSEWRGEEESLFPCPHESFDKSPRNFATEPVSAWSDSGRWRYSEDEREGLCPVESRCVRTRHRTKASKAPFVHCMSSLGLWISA